MKRLLSLKVGVALLVGLLCAGTALALDGLSRPRYDAVAFVQDDQKAAQAETACSTCGDMTCADCCRCPGLIGGAELLLMDPHTSAGNNWGGPGGPFTEWGYEPAWRFWLGYQGANGAGVRVRYFEFDHNQTYFDPEKLENANVRDISLDYDAWYVDIEYFDNVQIGHWNAILHGGARHAELTRFDSIRWLEDPILYENRVLAKGWGLTAGVELRRPTVWMINLYADLRGSILFGDSVGQAFQNGQQVDGSFLENGTGAILEISTGVEKAWDLASGAQIFGRLGAEAQYWDGFIREFGNAEQGEAFGLFGWTFAVGLLR
ncbi:MAG: hypothetical protein NZ899_01495 [Thermoguttaceae bacterium]|nr:hypothetical protein [Thermoguttaceae bacterium]MDW8078608.1 hypothetical protein [Thermoguttaceae bacterium]